MKKIFYVFVFLISCNINARQLEEVAKKQEGNQIQRVANSDVTFQLPRFIFTYTNTRIIVKFNDPNNSKLKDNNYQLTFIVNGVDQKVFFDHNGVGNFYFTFRDHQAINVLIEDISYAIQPSIIPIWYILAPLIALLLFFVYKVVIALRRNHHHSKLVVKRNLDVVNTNPQVFESTLKVIRVADRDREE